MAIQELEDDLIRKIKLQRGVHSYFEQRSKMQSIFIKSILIVLPAMLTFIAFSDFDFLKIYLPTITENSIRLIIGSLSFILFITGILSEVFNISVVYERHREAIEQYSELLRNMKEQKSNLTEEQITNFNQRYFSISTNSIHISSKKFIRGEKFHLKNQVLRAVMKKNPFKCKWQIRKQALKDFK